MTQNKKLLPEWANQEAIILAWPDNQTDWAPWLTEVRAVYCQIISALNTADTGVILLIRQSEIENCQTMLSGNEKTLPSLAKVLLIVADYNDTWVRDYGFLTCSEQGILKPIEFTFNGWGQKFDANKDNKINQHVLAELCEHTIETIDLVVEGGALEINQNGILLSTQLCLLNPKRNGDVTIEDYQQVFIEHLGATQSIIFEHGHLEGDDTDGHIDTLVRFTPHHALVVQSAFNRPDDPHFTGLAALVAECHAALPQHQIFELPLPRIQNAEGQRLPASYANYLISNNQVLCPIYQQVEDQQAIKILQQAYPTHKIVAIDCLPLIQQFGSLHCISMQIPSGTLKPSVVAQLAKGVTLYAPSKRHATE